MTQFLNFRFLVLLIFAIVFIVLFYYYNDSLDAIVALEREKSKCQQGADTLSAQLQGNFSIDMFVIWLLMYSF